MATPIEASLPSYTLEETTCFATDVVGLLTPQLDEQPTTTVGQVADYLGALSTPESLELTIDDATAQAMAESSISCLDINRLAIAGLSAAFGVEVDEEAVAAAAACLDEELGMDTMRAMQRLQYQHGSDVMAHVEFTELMEIYSPAVERCMPPSAAAEADPARPGEPVEMSLSKGTATISGPAVDDGIVCPAASSESVRWDDLNGQSITELEYFRLIDEDMENGTITRGGAHIEFVCSNGSGVFRLIVTPAKTSEELDLEGMNEDVATWVVSLGSGAYEALSGQGTVDADYANEVWTYEGELAANPDRQ